MKKQKVFIRILGAFMLFCLPSCGQASSPLLPEATAQAWQNPVQGRIGEIILDGTASRLPVSVSISMENNAAVFQITDKTLFLDSTTGECLPPTDLLEAHDACIYANAASACAEAVLLHIPENTAPAHLHTVEEISAEGNGLLITTENGSLHLSVPDNALLSFYADNVKAAPESIQAGDRVFAWYDSIAETWPMQASTERLVIVPAEKKLPETLPEGLSLSVLPGSISPDGASFRLQHNTDAQITYGSDFTLQKKEGGEWANLPSIIENGAFTMEAYNLPKGEPRTLEINWAWLYGDLPAGEYRLVKNVIDFRGSGDYDNYPLIAEFLIPAYY